MVHDLGRTEQQHAWATHPGSTYGEPRQSNRARAAHGTHRGQLAGRATPSPAAQRTGVLDVVPRCGRVLLGGDAEVLALEPRPASRGCSCT